jgi:hypothetical protein
MPLTNKTIDWSLIQDCDILITSCPGVLEDLIKAGEVYADEYKDGDGIFKSIEDAVDAAVNANIPSHTLFVYDVATMVGVEQTWPEARFCSLHEYESIDPKNSKDHTIEVFRCPWFSEKHNPSAKELINNMKIWLNNYVAGNNSYSIQDLFAFLNVIPEDKAHTTCSLFVTLGLLKNVQLKGYECNFPIDWVVQGPDGLPCAGLVSPWEIDEIFNANGWGTAFQK